MFWDPIKGFTVDSLAKLQQPRDFTLSALRKQAERRAVEQQRKNEE